MTKTSTLISSSETSVKTGLKAGEAQLPEFDEPSASSIRNILNYSRSLKIMKSELIKSIEVVNT